MKRSPTLVLAAILLVLLGAVYGSVYGHQFVFDDHFYIRRNGNIHSGLTWSGIRWAFGAFFRGNWHPATWLSHMLDVSLFGLDPRGHHLMNLALHAANCFLLWGVLWSMTGSRGKSWVIAVIFALHPLHVESAAWVSERKDVLSAFFGLLSMSAYVAYRRRPSARRYLLVAALLALGLLSKPMLVTFPILFLLLDYYPLGVFPGGQGNSVRRRAAIIARAAAEKGPLLVLSGISSAVTVAAQQRTGALSEGLEFGFRLTNAVISYAKYFVLTVWPHGLACYYPHSGTRVDVLEFSPSAAFLLTVTVGTFRFRHRAPWALMGWLWFLVSLVPVIGLVQVGAQAMADRYSYIPMIGLLVAFVWGFDALAHRLPPCTPGRIPAAAVVIIACASLTRIQVGYWKDEVTLFERALAVTKGNWPMHSSLAASYIDRGDWGKAIHHYREAVRISPRDPQLHFRLGVALAQTGQSAEGEFHFSVQRALLQGEPPPTPHQ